MHQSFALISPDSWSSLDSDGMNPQLTWTHQFTVLLQLPELSFHQVTSIVVTSRISQIISISFNISQYLSILIGHLASKLCLAKSSNARRIQTSEMIPRSILYRIGHLSTVDELVHAILALDHLLLWLFGLFLGLRIGTNRKDLLPVELIAGGHFLKELQPRRFQSQRCNGPPNITCHICLHLGGASAYFGCRFLVSSPTTGGDCSTGSFRNQSLSTKLPSRILVVHSVLLRYSKNQQAFNAFKI